MKWNIGIIGAGNIAAHMARTVARMENACNYAVAARELSRAEDFARQYGVEKAYGSYEALLSDPKVDLVYIATPHSHHYGQIKLSLEAGKHVLCEKAFTVTGDQAQAVCNLAQQKGLLLTEAIWTRYMPFSKTIRELIDGGAVGEPVALNANLGYNVRHKQRCLRPELAGGALLDITIYALNFAYMTFGSAVTQMVSSAAKWETGVDAQESISLSFASGRMASLYGSMLTNTDRRAVIYGDKGYLVVENINNPQWAQFYLPDWKPVQRWDCPPQISGYEYQVEACFRAISQGCSQCDEMPHDETVRVMRVLDTLRKEWGIIYPDAICSL